MFQPVARASCSVKVGAVETYADCESVVCVFNVSDTVLLQFDIDAHCNN